MSAGMGTLCRLGQKVRLKIGGQAENREPSDRYAAAMLKVLDIRGVASGSRALLPRPDLAGEAPTDDVRAILAEVRAHGDAALREYTKRFDGVEIDDFRVPADEFRKASRRIAPGLLRALSVARDNIEAFHRWRAGQKGSYERDGIRIEHLEIPVSRAGVYVPGGRALYPSSVLMTAIPPKVAGVGGVVLCVPPGRDGRVPDEILAAAHLAGVDELYRVGGAQAIAAMAHGTESAR